MKTGLKIIGQSAKIKEALRTTDLVAATDVPVLIIGDIGTGKNLFGVRVHSQSSRKQRPFVKINCSSFTEIQADEILFGRNGAIWQARSGTLLLNEIYDLSKSLQERLIHFLEEKEGVSKSSNIACKYDVRIVATTQKNLYQEVDARRFRADLYYRLNVVPIELPTLKEREGDISLLMDYFFCQFVHKQHLSAPSFTKAAQKRVMCYSWPGNIRELHNFCERMFTLFSGKTIDVTNLPHEFTQFSKSQVSPFSLPSTGVKLELVEVDLMQQALEATGGNKSQAARLLGLTRDTFLYRLKKYAIEM